MSRKKLKISIWLFLLISFGSSFADNPYTGQVPRVFLIPDTVMYHSLVVISPLYSDSLRFVFRSSVNMYAIAHHGTEMWNKNIVLPNFCGGYTGITFGAADIDGDGVIEIAALNNNNEIKIYNSLDGSLENSFDISEYLLNINQIAGHIMIVNLQGEGRREAIIQTVDKRENGNVEYYINRSLIAIDLQTGAKIWQVDQNGNPLDGIYEGYWGQAHGGLICADVDDDGLDEVIGGNLIDDNGDEVDIGYDQDWVGIMYANNYIDHLDAVAVGDFRPDLPGLEWVVTEENYHSGESPWVWRTVMLRYDTLNPLNGIVWAKDFEGFSGAASEPQNIAVGDFDTNRDYCEVWNRSRFPSTLFPLPGYPQYPWVYDNIVDTAFVEYDIRDVLQHGFHSVDNGYGLEIVWTIDWEGGDKYYIAGKARNDSETKNIGVFDPIETDSVYFTIWATGREYSSIYARYYVVADIGGDSREEVIVNTVKNDQQYLEIYWNDEPNLSNPPKPNKWNDPLYTRLKQSSNYYSPGGYMQRDPVKVRTRIFLEGPYTFDSEMDTILKENGVIPLQSPYNQDPRFVESIPDSTVDWVLVQLRKIKTGHPIISRSCFLRKDGYIITEENTTADFFVEEGDYYIVVRHRNHLDVMSSSAVSLSRVTSDYDFTTGTDQYEGIDAVQLETGVYGMYAGDGNESGIVTISDANLALSNRDNVGYEISDYNLSGIVTISDVNHAIINRDKHANVN